MGTKEPKPQQLPTTTKSPKTKRNLHQHSTTLQISTSTEKFEVIRKTHEADSMRTEEIQIWDHDSQTQILNHSTQEEDTNLECQEDHICRLPELVELSVTLVDTQTTNQVNAPNKEDAQITEERNSHLPVFQKTK